MCVKNREPTSPPDKSQQGKQRERRHTKTGSRCRRRRQVKQRRRQSSSKIKNLLEIIFQLPPPQV